MKWRNLFGPGGRERDFSLAVLFVLTGSLVLVVAMVIAQPMLSSV